MDNPKVIPNWGTVVVWKDVTDLNSNWTLEEVAKEDMDIHICVSNATVGQFTPMTLSVDVLAGEGDLEAAYEVVGMSTVDDRSKLVLAAIDGTIPAGTPFIANFAITQSSDGSNVGLGQLVLAADVFDGIHYGFDAYKDVNGLAGVLVQNDTIIAGMWYFQNGAVKAVGTNATQIIRVGSAYLNGYIPATSAEGDATIDLGKKIVTSLTNDQVVVLPSTVNVYSVNGTLLRKAVKSANAAKGLPAGVYVIGGHKVIVK